jgi:hypothetical protein
LSPAEGFLQGNYVLQKGGPKVVSWGTFATFDDFAYNYFMPQIHKEEYRLL